MKHQQYDCVRVCVLFLWKPVKKRLFRRFVLNKTNEKKLHNLDYYFHDVLTSKKIWFADSFNLDGVCLLLESNILFFRLLHSFFVFFSSYFFFFLLLFRRFIFSFLIIIISVIPCAFF